MTGMGRRKRVDGAEADAFSRWSRRYLILGRGFRSSVKRKVHKRERAEGKRETRSAD